MAKKKTEEESTAKKEKVKYKTKQEVKKIYKKRGNKK